MRHGFHVSNTHITNYVSFNLEAKIKLKGKIVAIDVIRMKKETYVGGQKVYFSF